MFCFYAKQVVNGYKQMMESILKLNICINVVHTVANSVIKYLKNILINHSDLYNRWFWHDMLKKHVQIQSIFKGLFSFVFINFP